MKHFSSIFILTAAIAFVAGVAAAAQGGTGSQNSAPLTGVDQQPGPNDYSDQIIWSFEDPSRALFIPQRQLDRTPLDELPVNPADLRPLHYALRFPQDRVVNHFPNHCLYEAHLDAQVSESRRKTITQWVSGATLAFVGTVVDMVPGWTTLSGGRPVTMVYLRVDDILRNEGDRYNEAGFLYLGQTVAYEEDQATIKLSGTEACSKLPDGAAVAEMGGKVLFTGGRHDSNPLLLSGEYVFSIRSGQVLPLPWTVFKKSGEVSFQDLRATVARETQP